MFEEVLCKMLKDVHKEKPSYNQRYFNGSDMKGNDK